MPNHKSVFQLPCAYTNSTRTTAVLSHEDQLDDYMEARRMLRAEVWSFLRPGEGEVAEAVATAKFEEASRRQARLLTANMGWEDEGDESEDDANDDTEFDDNFEEGDLNEGTYGSIDLMDNTLANTLSSGVGDFGMESPSRTLQSTKKSGTSVTINAPPSPVR